MGLGGSAPSAAGATPRVLLCQVAAYHGPGPGGRGAVTPRPSPWPVVPPRGRSAEHLRYGGPTRNPGQQAGRYGPRGRSARRPVCWLGARSRRPGRPLAANGGGVRCGPLGPRACLGAARGRSAYRLSVPPAASGQGSPPGGAAAASPCPARGGQGSPRARPTGRGSWAPVCAACGPPCVGGGPLSVSARVPRPFRPAPGPPSPGHIGRPGKAMGRRWQLPPGGAQGRPKAAQESARAPGSKGLSTFYRTVPARPQPIKGCTSGQGPPLTVWARPGEL